MMRKPAEPALATDIKHYFFGAPNSAVNFRNPRAFGKIAGSQGSYSGVGGRLYMYVIFKLQF